MSKKEKKCYQCQRDENSVAILKMRYKGQKFYVCPQHLPPLIHNPASIANVVPGAESWEIPGEDLP